MPITRISRCYTAATGGRRRWRWGGHGDPTRTSGKTDEGVKPRSVRRKSGKIRTTTGWDGDLRIKQKPRSEARFGQNERSGMPQVDEAVGLVAELDARLAERLVPVTNA